MQSETATDTFGSEFWSRLTIGLLGDMEQIAPDAHFPEGKQLGFIL